FVNANYNFVGRRHFFIGLSLSLLALSILAIATHGFSYSVEFLGGAQLEVNFNETGKTPTAAADIDTVRKALEAGGVHQASVVTIGADTDHDFLIRVEQAGGEELEGNLRSALIAAFGETKVTGYSFDKQTR